MSRNPPRLPPLVTLCSFPKSGDILAVYENGELHTLEVRSATSFEKEKEQPIDDWSPLLNSSVQIDQERLEQSARAWRRLFGIIRQMPLQLHSPAVDGQKGPSKPATGPKHGKVGRRKLWIMIFFCFCLCFSHPSIPSIPPHAGRPEERTASRRKRLGGRIRRQRYGRPGRERRTLSSGFRQPCQSVLEPILLTVSCC